MIWTTMSSEAYIAITHIADEDMRPSAVIIDAAYLPHLHRLVEACDGAVGSRHAKDCKYGTPIQCTCHVGRAMSALSAFALTDLEIIRGYNP